MSTGVEWLAGLSPWPLDGFGLDRMQALLRALGDPQASFPAVHVVGTNGKSTATRTIESMLGREGLLVGATVSPHVRRWSERITVGGAEIDVDAAVERVRPHAERLGATQFETITAAALQSFADRKVDVAVVEAGLGGRLDATNVLRTRVVLLTNVGLDHTDVLGPTVADIAREKLAVAHVDSVVVLPDDRFAGLVPGRRCVLGGAVAAAEAFVGRRLAPPPPIDLPGRLERREGEIRDGAHNADGVRWLAARLPTADYTICASILRDKDVEAMLDVLAAVGSRFVATTSANARALSADELADRARPRFAHVEAQPTPSAALARAHALGEPVLVTGSLYLLAELEAVEPRAADAAGRGRAR